MPHVSTIFCIVPSAYIASIAAWHGRLQLRVRLADRDPDRDRLDRRAADLELPGVLREADVVGDDRGVGREGVDPPEGQLLEGIGVERRRSGSPSAACRRP